MVTDVLMHIATTHQQQTPLLHNMADVAMAQLKVREWKIQDDKIAHVENGKCSTKLKGWTLP